MPRKKKNMARSANGNGTIRKKTVTRNGKQYTYWEARYTEGYDPGTGKQIQKSITGKTQKEVAQKLKERTLEIDQRTYIAPSKMTVGEWLDIWTNDYLIGVKPATVDTYQSRIRTHIKPALGAIRLEELNAHTIQHFYNGLKTPGKTGKALSPKTIKNVHGILHKALRQAVLAGYLHVNPADSCKLPRVTRRPLDVFDKAATKEFLMAIQNHPFRILFLVTLFTGMRESEVLGLLWKCVDFDRGTILVEKQLYCERKKNPKYLLVDTKNDRKRVITPAPWVMKLLEEQRAAQVEQRRNAGSMWEESGYVFTNEIGRFIPQWKMYRTFKAVVKDIGHPNTRVHDLRHSYG